MPQYLSSGCSCLRETLNLGTLLRGDKEVRLRLQWCEYSEEWEVVLHAMKARVISIFIMFNTSSNMAELWAHLITTAKQSWCTGWQCWRWALAQGSVQLCPTSGLRAVSCFHVYWLLPHRHLSTGWVFHTVEGWVINKMIPAKFCSKV